MWSCVCESCSSSAFINLIWSISISSCFISSSVRLTSVFSRSLIIFVTSERLSLMKRMSSEKILSLSSTAVCAECCRSHIIIISYCTHSLLWDWKSPSITDRRRVLAEFETSSYSSSQNSPCKSLQPLSDPKVFSFSPWFASCIFSVYHPSVSMGQSK